MSFEFNPWNVALVVLTALFSTGLCEFVSWLLVYRKEDYKLMKSKPVGDAGEIEKLNKKVEKKRSIHVIQAQNKSHEKKLNSVEEQLKSLNRELTWKNMKSNVIIGIFMLLFINFVGTQFQGIVVAKLPFTPFSLIQGITHRNIAGTDMTDCSYLFIYILSAFLFRTNIKKVMGCEVNAPAQSLFEPPKP